MTTVSRRNIGVMRRLGLYLLVTMGVLSTLATGGGSGTAPAPPDDEPPSRDLIWDQGNWDEVEWQ